MIELEIIFKNGDAQWYSLLIYEKYYIQNEQIILVLYNGYYEYEFNLNDIYQRIYRILK